MKIIAFSVIISTTIFYCGYSGLFLPGIVEGINLLKSIDQVNREIVNSLIMKIWSGCLIMFVAYYILEIIIRNERTNN